MNSLLEGFFVNGDAYYKFPFTKTSLEALIRKANPYCKRLFVKQVIAISLYLQRKTTTESLCLEGKSSFEAFIHEGNP